MLSGGGGRALHSPSRSLPRSGVRSLPLRPSSRTFPAMKTVTSRVLPGRSPTPTLLMLLLLLGGSRVRTEESLPAAAPCFDRPDVAPAASVARQTAVSSVEGMPTAHPEAELLPGTTPAAAAADLNGPAEETTTTTTAAASVSLGGSFSNVISGGAGGEGGGGLLSLFGATQRTTPEKKGPSGNFDQYLDNILGNLTKTLRQSGFDPLALGNMLQCRNCTLEGLSLIRRNGPSNLKYANRTLTVDAHLQLPALYISCFPCVQVILMVPFTGMLEVALWDLQIYGEVTQRTERNAHPSLTEYRVVREGDLDVTLNGYGLLGPVTEMGFKILQQRQVSEIVRQFVYDRIPNFIEEKLQGFSFPIGK